MRVQSTCQHEIEFVYCVRGVGQRFKVRGLGGYVESFRGGRKIIKGEVIEGSSEKRAVKLIGNKVEERVDGESDQRAAEQSNMTGPYSIFPARMPCMEAKYWGHSSPNPKDLM